MSKHDDLTDWVRSPLVPCGLHRGAFVSAQERGSQRRRQRCLPLRSNPDERQFRTAGLARRCRSPEQSTPHSFAPSLQKPLLGT